MKIRIIPVTPFSQNCSLLICESTQKAALVDPGGDIERIFEVINEESVTIEKILLTHGHLDHCGYIPKLYKDGFRGPIFCTAPTKEIANIILSDNANIQSGNAIKHNKKIKKDSLKVKPLYTQTQQSLDYSLYPMVYLGKILQAYPLQACRTLRNNSL